MLWYDHAISHGLGRFGCGQWEGMMRSWTLALIAGATLMAMTAPASAVWKGYISHSLGFAFAAPGELKIEKGKYQGAVAGPHEATVLRAIDDNIEYKVMIVDVTPQANQAATLLGEAEYIFQDGKKV